MNTLKRVENIPEEKLDKVLALFIINGKRKKC